MLDSEGPMMRTNVIAVVAPPTGDYQMSLKSEIRQDTVARGQVEVVTPLETVTRGEDGVYRVSCQGRMVLWVPEEEHELQARLMVFAHMQNAGHRGVRATPIASGHIVHGTTKRDSSPSVYNVPIRKRAMLCHVRWTI